jgi:hypothetical protein
MINTDQLHYLTHCCYPYMCFFSHFELIPHQWQMTASVTNRNEQQQNSNGHCSNWLFVNSGHGLWLTQTLYTIWHTAGTPQCALFVTLTWFLTSDKPWPLWQIATSNSKTVMGNEATATLWIQDMYYDQYRPSTLFDTLLVPIHVLRWSLWLDSSPVANDCLCDK